MRIILVDFLKKWLHDFIVMHITRIKHSNITVTVTLKLLTITNHCSLFS